MLLVLFTVLEDPGLFAGAGFEIFTSSSGSDHRISRLIVKKCPFKQSFENPFIFSKKHYLHLVFIFGI
jgi:hypothetical protein